MDNTVLSPTDIPNTAIALGVETAALRAVLAVESAGDGFLDDGRPKILFEAHVFSRLTGGKYDKSHPDLSTKKWNKKLYLGGAGEWTRLKRAIALDSEAALQSASWGAGQIMGFNFRVCDYGSVEEFVAAMEASAKAQLIAFCAFLRGRNLVYELQRKDWAAFAAGYNGPLYARNGYDTKLAKAYEKFANEEKANKAG